MPNHDMSKSASIERAAHTATHEKISKDITEIYQRLDTLLSIVVHMNPKIMDDFEAFLKSKETTQ